MGTEAFLPHIVRASIVTLLLPWCTTLTGQKVYRDGEQALREPTQVKKLVIECENGNCGEVLHRIDALSELTHLQIASGNLSTKQLKVLFKKVSALEKIAFLSFRDIEFDHFPDPVSGPDGSIGIAFDDCGGMSPSGLTRTLKSWDINRFISHRTEFQQLPKSIGNWEKLRAIYIAENPVLDAEGTIASLTRLDQLEALSLPINNINAIPPNIGRLSGVEKLDVTGNELADLPAELQELKGLEDLSIEGNYILDPVPVLKKIRDLNIRDLSLDKLTPKELEQVKQMFPDADVEEKELDEGYPEDTLFGKEKADKTKKEYGEFKVSKDKIEAYSMAYLRYPTVMKRALMDPGFDSTLFEERFRDTAYANLYRWQRRFTRDYITRVYFHESTRDGSIYFDLRPGDKDVMGVKLSPYGSYSNFLKDRNKEIRAFQRMKWSYNGPMNEEAFRAKFDTMRYSDLRIRYRAADKDFDMILKYRGGYDTIPALPVYKFAPEDLSRARKRYEKLHKRYMRFLERRKARFNSRIIKKKERYKENLAERKQDAWEDFRDNYLSKKEKEMSRTQWLAYYDRVIANEEEALRNAMANFTGLKRSLQRDGFIMVANNRTGLLDLSNRETDLSLMDKGESMIRKVQFTDQDSSRLPVEGIYLVFPETKEFIHYRGEFGVDPYRCFSGKDPSACIVVMLRNGDMGVCPPGDLEKLKASEEKNDGVVALPVRTLEKELGSVGQLRKMMGF